MTSPRDILVTGGRGRLGRALGALGCSAFGRDKLDITSEESILRAVETHAPRTIVNCAAYTAVDRAEEEPDLAYAINRDAAARLAAVCHHWRIPLIHISTDCVFGDGDVTRPVTENDPTEPLSVYGASKLEGERAVRAAGRQRVCVARICWLFDDASESFISKILNAAKTRPTLQLVTDAYGRPTLVGDLASQILQLATRLANGMPTPEVLHFGSRDPVNRLDWAKVIFAKSAALGGPSPDLVPCSSDTLRETARRPRNLIMDVATASALIGDLTDWRQATEQVVAAILRD